MHLFPQWRTIDFRYLFLINIQHCLARKHKTITGLCRKTWIYKDIWTWCMSWFIKWDIKRHAFVFSCWWIERWRLISPHQNYYYALNYVIGCRNNIGDFDKIVYINKFPSKLYLFASYSFKSCTRINLMGHTSRHIFFNFCPTTHFSI